MTEFSLSQVVGQRLDGRKQDRLRIAEQVFVSFELVELVGELLNLLHLVVDHLDVFGDVLRLIENLLNVHRRVVNDSLRASRDRDAERDERECNESLHGVFPFFCGCRHGLPILDPEEFY